LGRGDGFYFLKKIRYFFIFLFWFIQNIKMDGLLLEWLLRVLSLRFITDSFADKCLFFVGWYVALSKESLKTFIKS